MNINRYNYEEYFLLYTDNELMPDEKQMVENFVLQNPDLKEELDILNNSKLIPDTKIGFGAKSLLYRSENTLLVNNSNYEKYLLSYIDNELTADERAAVELFMKNNSAAQAELNLLLNTKLQPEAEIVFPGKLLLYRKEEKPVRVLYYKKWMRYAAAAILLLTAGITVFLTQQKTATTNDTPPIAGVNEIKPEKKTDMPEKVIVKASNTDTNNQDNKVMPKTNLENTTDKNIEYVKTKKKEKSFNNNSTPQPVYANNTSIKNAAEEEENITDLIKRSNKPAKSIDIASNQTTISSWEIVNTNTVTIESLTPLDNQIADNRSANNNIRGLLRKATRIFEKATNIDATPDDDKLLIGSFAISLK